MRTKSYDATMHGKKISGFGCLFTAIDLKQLKLSPVRIADVMRNETEG